MKTRRRFWQSVVSTQNTANGTPHANQQPAQLEVMPPNALHTAVAYRNVQPRAQVISPGPVSKQVDSNVASAENRLPQQVPADIRFEDVYALHSTRRQKKRQPPQISTHSQSGLINCYGLSLVTPWQVGEAVPLDASRDDWHRERSKTRSRRTAWCGRDVKKS